jgi:mersacidin/lichenicidin family type 2 lantibiotic
MNTMSSGRLNKRQIARAWADPVYRASLSDEARGQLPAHPAGTGDEVLDEVRGWGDPTWYSCDNTCAFSCSCTRFSECWCG